MKTEEFLQRTEGIELEVKRAQGRSGKGELPPELFPTYSAFANTSGGLILLGVGERPDGTLEVVGIPQHARVVKDLWSGLNNTQRVNVNLLEDADVTVLDVEGKHVVSVRVPRAKRTQKPVFVGTNPMTGTYRRSNDGDFKCPDDVVRRMLAEQRQDTRDDDVLEHFGLEDLNKETVRHFRQRVASRTPDHPFVAMDDAEFLRCIHAWRRDRETGKSGLTPAGLLMFGNLVSIQERFPTYMLDFQERPEPKAELRWVDRVSTDGAWSGNLYDFYHLVMPRLTRGLKVPFALKAGTRVEDTAVHEALREALVNTLIHADYTGRASVLVVKRPDMFGFRNPGTMRIAVDHALAGGNSDCRNRRLQDMFRLVGLGEQAGSGIPKIRNAWRGQHWASPLIEDVNEPTEQTLFRLSMVNLLPQDTMQDLERRFGPEELAAVSEVQRLALVTVATEGQVNHQRLLGMTDSHARDVSLGLSGLVRRGWLASNRDHKRTNYFFLGDTPPSALAAFDDLSGTSLLVRVVPAASSPDGPEAVDQPAGSSSVQSAPSSVQSAPSSVHKDPGTPEVMPPLTAKEVEQLAALRASKRASASSLRDGILMLCRGRFLTLPELASFTGRSMSTLRIHHLTALQAQGALKLRFPDQPTHPQQAYTTVVAP